jgi:hypothetical protein
MPPLPEGVFYLPRYLTSIGERAILMLFNRKGNTMYEEKDDSISWGELAQLTHATQVERFNFCLCEEQETFPYADCPKS